MSGNITNTTSYCELYERQNLNANVPLKKKRKVLKRTQIKEARIKGQKYVNYRGLEKAQRKLGPNCK